MNALTAERTAELSPALRDLVCRLDEICAGPVAHFDERIRQALARAAMQPGLLTAAQRQPEPGSYARHVLHADPSGRYTLVALVWDGGQFSPVHAHYTWCGYAVVDGCLREDHYRWLGRGEAAEHAGTVQRSSGSSTFAHAGMDAIHRLGNPAPGCAVSLHVYGVDSPRVASHVNRLLDVVAPPAG